MDDLLNDFDDPHYYCYDDYQPGTPETAYKIIEGHRCVLKRGLDYLQLYFISSLLRDINKHVLPGTEVHYTCFSVSYLHALRHGLEVDREKYSTAKLADWKDYIAFFRDVTGLPLRMGTREEVLIYTSGCFDVLENHPIDWGKLFATDGDGYVMVDVFSEEVRVVTEEDDFYGDVLLGFLEIKN